MKKIIALLLSIIAGYSYSQNLEISGGPNFNMFFDHRDEGHYYSDYTPAIGYTFAIGIDSLTIYGIRKQRITLQFDSYSGDLNVGDGGLGGGYSTQASIDKSVLSLAVFPINLTILNNLEFNVGAVLSILMKESFKGTVYGWSVISGGSHQDIKDRYDEFNSKANFGFQGRIAYDLKIKRNIWLTPQYQCYIGVTKEFIGFPEKTKSLRNYLSLGVKFKI